MKIQFCCRRFKELIDRAGERGLAVVVSRNGQNPLKFRLQSRGVAHQDEVESEKTSARIVINIQMLNAIEYCPFCGKHLQELLNTTPVEYEELAKKHLPFVTMPDVSAEAINRALVGLRRDH
jgi:hypothetical protein